MNTQLKKGDRCQSPWGIVTIVKSKGIDVFICKADDSLEYEICTGFLKKIPISDKHDITHAERMQKIIDTVFAAENNFEDDQFIPMKVGEMAEFVRHYLALRASLECGITRTRSQISEAEYALEQREKLLKGEA